MKKLIALTLALLTLLSFCACGNGAETDTSPVVVATEAPTEHVATEEEKVAAEILYYGVKLLNNPTYTTVKNVWIKKSTLCYITYELEIKNSYGNMETVYYTTEVTKWDNESLSRTLSLIVSASNARAGMSFLYGSDGSEGSCPMGFEKDKTTAKTGGEQLDAPTVQDLYEHYVP